MHGADGLEESMMLAFARETHLSETTFVQPATDARADYRNRIFDPRQELPFAGHPSLGTAVAVARERDAHAAEYVQQTPAGLQPVRVQIDGARASASMLQEPAVFGPLLDADAVLPAAGLSGSDADSRLPVQVVSTGVPQVLAPLSSVDALARARPDWAAIEGLLDAHDAIVIYLAHCDPQSGTARARAFTHSAEMGEDPGTGSAAGPLCAHLHAQGAGDAVEIVQGVEMGRRSVLRCSVEGDRVRVAGDVVVVAEGSVYLP